MNAIELDILGTANALLNRFVKRLHRLELCHGELNPDRRPPRGQRRQFGVRQNPETSRLGDPQYGGDEWFHILF